MDVFLYIDKRMKCCTTAILLFEPTLKYLLDP
ncbi:unnamed protein product, partial [Callosobruchus maculatus]